MEKSNDHQTPNKGKRTPPCGQLRAVLNEMVPSSVTVYVCIASYDVIVISNYQPQKNFISNKAEKLILFLGIKSELKEKQVPAYPKYLMCSVSCLTHRLDGSKFGINSVIAALFFEFLLAKAQL